jgi:hypothetical protein
LAQGDDEDVEQSFDRHPREARRLLSGVRIFVALVAGAAIALGAVTIFRGW